MNTENFEERLRNQPLRPIPTEWREEILAATKVAVRPRRPSFDAQPHLWWRELLWPSPQAWASLAAVWLAILAVNFSTGNGSQVAAKGPQQSSPELIAVLRQHERLMVELIGPHEKPAAGCLKQFQFQPRSELRNNTLTV
ncbi:MAG: hypothetical protein ABSC38_01760 [Verrucomicrobiia bacterium]